MVNASVPFQFIDMLRAAVANAPSTLESERRDLRLLDWNLTTVCYSNANTTGEYECQCEDSFRWSCEICNTFNTCSNESTPTCDCIRGIPPFLQFCEPISVISPCQVPPTEALVDIFLILDPTPNGTEPLEIINQLRTAVVNGSLPFEIEEDLTLINWNLTTVISPCQVPPTEALVDIFLILDPTPNGTEPLEIINQLRTAVVNGSLPFEIEEDLTLINWNLTTACYPNSTGEPLCQCEDSFGWSCDICNTFDVCSTSSTPTCDCIYGLPPFGQFCEPVSIISPCPPPPITESASVNSVLHISTLSIEATEIIEGLRDAVAILPVDITIEVILTNFILTTVCHLNFNNEEQCECGDQYLWPCGICETFGACNSNNMQTCDCINRIPPDGILCVPSVAAACPTESPPTVPPIIDSK
ncbi:uncharacterized protein LOC144039762 [Vanacampus margaritifer]